jgi:hypothetical protein
MGIVVAAAAIIVAPLSLLFIYPHGTFNIEWGDSLWFIAYDRAYIASHFAFPAALNFAGHVGVPRPIFYGPLLYPILGLLAVPLGASGAVRVLAAAIWLLQFALIFRLCRAIGRSSIEALAAAALVSWSVYSLTNLYNRGALAEFYGTGFLLCAIAAKGASFYESNRWRHIGFVLLSAICAAMAFGSHGPTALVGGTVLILLAASTVLLEAFTFSPSDIAATAKQSEELPQSSKDGRPKLFPEYRLKRSTGAAAFLRHLATKFFLGIIIFLILSPWISAALRFSGHLNIQEDATEFPTPHHWHPIASNDSLWARFKPLPVTDQDSVVDRNTPYLDANWNCPLAILAAWNAALISSRRLNRNRIDRRYLQLVVWSSIGSAALLALSVSSTLQNALPYRIPATVQFPYRLVAHANILLFTTLVAAWGARSAVKLSPGLLKADRMVLAVAVCVAVISLCIKLDHAAVVAVADGADRYDPGDQTELLAADPGVYVGQNDFALYIPEQAVPPEARTSAAKVDAPLGIGPQMESKESTFTLPQSWWVVSNVLNFPWSHLIVDGKEIPFDQVHNLYFHQAVELPAGTHTFGFRFVPGPQWVFLSRLSWTVLALLAIATLICFVIPARR